MTKLRILVAAAFVAVFGLAFGGSALGQVGDLPGMDHANESTDGGLEAAAVNELGDADHGPCVETLLDLPALDSCRDANGRVIMDLPALKLVGPAEAVKHGHDAPRSLPATGVNAGDFAAMGGAAFAAGAVLLRRVRLALAS